MKVMVTGGTGFVGSHTVAELLHRGHQVKLLVRNLDRVRAALNEFGEDNIEIVLGDVTDPAAVAQAAEECGATIHCASVYSLDPRAAAHINQTNVQGTETVIKAAVQAGHDPIVHVSSVAAIIGRKNDLLSPASVPDEPPGVYFRSKADSDKAARKYQDQGLPVVITYPGSVWGPDDPHLGESCQMASAILRRWWSLTPRGTAWITDVRDLARLHVAVLEKGRGARRYIAPVTNVSIVTMMSVISSLTGRRLATLSLPPWLMLNPLRALDNLQRILPNRLPVNYQEAYGSSLGSRMDDAATRRDFNLSPRPLKETFADTITWMVQAGHLSPKLAGRLGEVI